MIEFFYEGGFELDSPKDFTDWITRVILSEDAILTSINYIFCEDEYLLKINQDYLDHNNFTDIITFDYSVGSELRGDIFISTERVLENATTYKKAFDDELLRVMSHGILHLLGYNDKSKEDIIVMRNKEEEKIKMFHVEQR